MAKIEPFEKYGTKYDNRFAKEKIDALMHQN